MGDTDSRDDDEIRANAELLELLISDRHDDGRQCDDLCNAACRAYDDIHALLARATAAEERIEAVRMAITKWDNDNRYYGSTMMPPRYDLIPIKLVLAALGPSTAPEAEQ